MNILSVLLLLLIGAWMIFAVLHIARHGSCGCGGRYHSGCNGHSCTGNCAGCKKCRMK